MAHRELVGKERMGGAGLLLRLLAGQALLRLRKLEEAQVGGRGGRAGGGAVVIAP